MNNTRYAVARKETRKPIIFIALADENPIICKKIAIDSFSIED
jgi:hypothetical protein